MSEDPKQILEAIKKRRLDIEIMQLQLKHNLTRKRTESKILIMYYKACNTISKAKLVIQRINDHNIKAPQPPDLADQMNDNCQKTF